MGRLVPKPCVFLTIHRDTGWYLFSLLREGSREIMKWHAAPAFLSSPLCPSTNEWFQVLENPDPYLLQSGMTAVSVLTRVLPILLESYANSETGEVDPVLEQMFWVADGQPSSSCCGRDEVR